MKTYNTPRIAVFRKSADVMQGLALHSKPSDGEQLGNESTFEKTEPIPSQKDLWGE